MTCLVRAAVTTIIQVAAGYTIDGLSKDDGDGNENGEKCNRFRLQYKNFAHVMRSNVTFLPGSLPVSPAKQAIYLYLQLCVWVINNTCTQKWCILRSVKFPFQALK